nr:hypothetical protein Iba_chr11bCG6690 [Ipomoea batatas]
MSKMLVAFLFGRAICRWRNLCRSTHQIYITQRSYQWRSNHRLFCHLIYISHASYQWTLMGGRSQDH